MKSSYVNFTNKSDDLILVVTSIMYVTWSCIDLHGLSWRSTIVMCDILWATLVYYA